MLALNLNITINTINLKSFQNANNEPVSDPRLRWSLTSGRLGPTMSTRARTRTQSKAKYKREAWNYVFTKIFQTYPPFILSAIFYTVISWPGLLSSSATWLLLPTGLVLFLITILYLYLAKSIHWAWSFLTTATTIGLCLTTNRSRVAVIYILLVSPCLMGVLAPGFFFVYAVILLLVACLVYWVQYFFYVRLGWRFVVRLPRFRNSGSFSQSRLCKSCRDMLHRSQLLFGTWTNLARVEQSLQLHTTVERMKTSRQECDLCDAFLSREVENRRTSASTVAQRNYGGVTYTSANLESGGPVVKIWKDKPWSLDRLLSIGSSLPSPECHMQLHAPNFDSEVINVSEGMSQVADTYTSNALTM